MTNYMARSYKLIIVAYFLITTIICVGCKKESNAMEITNVNKSVDKLTSMKLSNKAEAEKQLGVVLTPMEGNDYFSFYEFKGEIPAFPHSTRTEVRISNDGKGRWFMVVDFKLPTCVDIKTIMKNYPDGIPSPPDPNDVSPDAREIYETRIKSGVLFFCFNYKTGCFNALSFDRTK